MQYKNRVVQVFVDVNNEICPHFGRKWPTFGAYVEEIPELLAVTLFDEENDDDDEELRKILAVYESGRRDQFRGDLDEQIACMQVHVSMHASLSYKSVIMHVHHHASL